MTILPNGPVRITNFQDKSTLDVSPEQLPMYGQDLFDNYIKMKTLQGALANQGTGGGKDYYNQGTGGAPDPQQQQKTFISNPNAGTGQTSNTGLSDILDPAKGVGGYGDASPSQRSAPFENTNLGIKPTSGVSSVLDPSTLPTGEQQMTNQAVSNGSTPVPL